MFTNRNTATIPNPTTITGLGVPDFVNHLQFLPPELPLPLPMSNTTTNNPPITNSPEFPENRDDIPELELAVPTTVLTSFPVTGSSVT
jgi:hypothetical protein